MTLIFLNLWHKILCMETSTFGSDYVEGTYQDTTVDIISAMHRDRIVTIDTDSTVSTVFKEARKLTYGIFSNI